MSEDYNPNEPLKFNVEKSIKDDKKLKPEDIFEGLEKKAPKKAPKKKAPKKAPKKKAPKKTKKAKSVY
tara:strand:- start:1410 stop:1613 length:204 start_codon:yes stop_codon:yes gene_type:complete